MKVLDRDSDLYKTYTGTFASQEEDLKKLNSAISGKQAEIKTAEKKLQDYIASLDI